MLCIITEDFGVLPAETGSAGMGGFGVLGAGRSGFRICSCCSAPWAVNTARRLGRSPWMRSMESP